jgi:hypothetical protein
MTEHSRQKFKVTRRHVIGGLASIPFAASFTPTFALADAPEINKFIYASSILCGIKLDKSFIALAHQIWGALTLGATDKEKRSWRRMINQISTLPANANSRKINKALRMAGRGAKEQARLLAKVWYTGRIKRKIGPKQSTFEVINYDDALVWLACDFTKPPVTCGGHFGYWQHPFTGKV